MQKSDQRATKGPDHGPEPAWTTLKKDAFGATECSPDGRTIRRDADAAPYLTRAVARHLARREARALIVLNGLHGIARLQSWDGHVLERQQLSGAVLYEAGQLSERWFREAARLLRQMHSRNLAHNDLAKEANCLALTGGGAGFIDFQLAWHAPRRGFIFRQMAREDIRHLLKHKQCYLPAALTTRERAILARPGIAARLWMSYYKPIYRWITRGILGWPERDGPAERVHETASQSTKRK